MILLFTPDKLNWDSQVQEWNHEQVLLQFQKTTCENFSFSHPLLSNTLLGTPFQLPFRVTLREIINASDIKIRRWNLLIT